MFSTVLKTFGASLLSTSIALLGSLTFDADFIFGKIIPTVLAFVVGYSILFFDARYVRKPMFYFQKDRLDILTTQIAVLTSQGESERASRERIEKKLDDLLAKRDNRK